MRILHSIVLDGWSAGSWYAVNMAHHLNLLGQENLFVCRPDCRTRREAEQAGLNIHDRINLEAKNPLRMVANLSALGQLLIDWKPDVICAHWGEDHSYWGILKGLYRNPVPLVRVRALDPKPPRAHRLSRWLHEKKTRMVITSNSYLRDCYLELFDLTENVVRIIPPGLDFTDFADIQIETNDVSGYKSARPTVGLVARFSPVKGHHVFFEAARLITAKVPDVRFLLGGFESELKTADLKQMAREAGVEGQTEIISERTGPSAPIIARFDVGVVSSVYSESVSRALLENLAAGVPVVATDVGGVPDILNEGEFGVLIPPEDHEKMADEVVQLLQNHQRRKEYGTAGREFIREKRTWEDAARKFAEVLAGVV